MKGFPTVFFLLVLTVAIQCTPASGSVSTRSNSGGLGNLLGNLLGPVLGQNGLVQQLVGGLNGGSSGGNLLQNLLGNNGLVMKLLRGLLGGGTSGNEGLLGGLLDPLIGENGVVTNLLNSLLGGGQNGEDLLDLLLGPTGVVTQLLNMLLGRGQSLNLSPLLMGTNGIILRIVDGVLRSNGGLIGPENILGGVMQLIFGTPFGQNGLQASVISLLQAIVTQAGSTLTVDVKYFLQSLLNILLGNGNVVSSLLSVIQQIINSTNGQNGLVTNLVTLIQRILSATTTLPGNLKYFLQQALAVLSGNTNIGSTLCQLQLQNPGVDLGVQVSACLDPIMSVDLRNELVGEISGLTCNNGQPLTYSTVATLSTADLTLAEQIDLNGFSQCVSNQLAPVP